MAGKNATKRARIIDRSLRHGFKRSWNELAEACVLADLGGLSESISERTIKEDIRMLRTGELGFPPAPIKNENGLYFYSDKNFTISKSPIQDEEAFALMQALDILNQFPEFEHSEKVSEVIDKLKMALELEEDTTLKDVISFEKTDYPAAQSWISLLYPHLKERNPLLLKYRPFNSETTLDARIIPLLLKEFNARWFLIGFLIENGQIMNYALDRIQSFENFYIDQTRLEVVFDPETYFKTLVGVSKSKEGPIHIRFQTTPFLSNYINTKKIHQSQKLIDDKNHLYELMVDKNPELISRLLSFGEDLWVVEPEELVEVMRKKVEAMLKSYS